MLIWYFRLAPVYLTTKGRKLLVEGWTIFDMIPRLCCIVFMLNRRKLESSVERKPQWENASTRLACTQASSAFSWQMIDLGGLTMLWVIAVVVPGVRRKWTDPALKSQSGSNVAPFCLLQFLPFLPAPTSFIDGVWLRALSWRRPLFPVVSFSRGLYHSRQKQKTQPSSKIITNK